jgi:hypothetical protein
MKFLATLLFSVLALTSAARAEEINLMDTAYTGFMNIVGNPHPVPLALQLHQTDDLESITTATGSFTQYRIDGAFLVDDEGGPYRMARVTYDIETGELDMRYTRTGAIELPTSFRLYGQLAADGTVTGTVYSGFSGNIGTFSVKASPGTTLIARPKYVGHWSGPGTYLPTGAVSTTRLVIAPSNGTVITPDTIEFAFSSGKTGTFYFKGAEFPFSHVVIDYLRHRLLMINNVGGGVNSSLEADIDLVTGNLTGFYTGQYSGRVIDFTHKRAEGGFLK